MAESPGTDLPRPASISSDMSDSGSTGTIDDIEVSLQGVTMLLNNEWQEAEDLFARHKLVWHPRIPTTNGQYQSGSNSETIIPCCVHVALAIQ